MNTDNKFYTNNINLSAALLAKDIPLFKFTKEAGITTFVFDFPDKCKEIETQWLTDSLEVFAYKYSQSLKRLKNIVYGGQNALQKEFEGR